MNRLSVDCDCDGNPAEPDMHDIGILASTDPLAIDQAAIDLVYLMPDSESLRRRIERQNGLYTLDVGERNGLDGVLALSEGWFDFYEHNLLYMQGAKESDLFLIQRPDGKFVSPKEVWGEKYANVEDPVLKENLVRAEILKCIAVGKPALATRGVTITNNNQIGFSDPVVLYLPKEQMTKMFDAYLRYKAKKANLLDNLKDVKRRLSAMEPKDAVFGEEGGSTKYVAFTKSVNEAIAALERSNFGEKPGQFDRICEKLHALETNADAY